MPYGYVYLVKDSLNNKLYVGATTSQNPHNYWKHHHRTQGRIGKSRTLLHQSIYKNGENHFSFMVLAEALNLEELDKLEQFYIEKYNTFHPNGYNLKGGGNKGKYPRHSSYRQTMRESTTAYFQDPKNREKTSIATVVAMARPEVRQNLIDSHNTPQYKKKISEALNSVEVKEALSRATSGSIWINNGKINKRLKPGNIIPDGFIEGRLDSGTRQWINNGTNNKMLSFNEQLPEGWKYGKLPTGSGTNSGMRWINNGIQNKMINKNESLPTGWFVGMVSA